MTSDTDRLVNAWATFQTASGGLKRPVTEADYEALHSLADDLTSRYF